VSGPRLEVRLDRIHHNARTLVERLAVRGISVTGVTKATLGSPEIARELLRAGVTSIGESRIENIEGMRRAGLSADMTLIRSPMLSQAELVVQHADVSLNTELDVIDRLSVAAQAQHRTHGVVLMVELGDLREGILPGDLEAAVRRTLAVPHIVLRGIGTNLACQSGVTPDARNMSELSSLVESLEATLGLRIDLVSGGNSANLDWALGGSEPGRINNLRLGESILLGREPLRRQPIDGLHTDAVTLVAEVIESKAKPTRAWGEINQGAFGNQPVSADRGSTSRVILALGRQDVDPDGLTAPAGFEILGASSDHLVVDAGAACPAVGSEVRFDLDYSALLRAMTSPFVHRVFTRAGGSGTTASA
jgi:predicted amino acid racemase